MANRTLKTNKDLRDYMEHKGVKAWQLADRIGISANTLSIRFRYELSEETKTQYKLFVDEIVDNNLIL